MYTPDTRFTDHERVKKWVAEQIEYANSIDKDIRDCALHIRERAYQIQGKLTRPDQQREQRRHQTITERLTREDKGGKPGSAVSAELLEQAYRKANPDIMQLVDEIITLRTKAEALPRKR